MQHRRFPFTRFHFTQAQPLHHTGSSLVEVMISVLLLSMALVGTFAMHRAAVSFTKQAQWANLNIIATSNMAEFILASPTGLSEISNAVFEPAITPVACTQESACDAGQFSDYYLSAWTHAQMSDVPDTVLDISAQSTVQIAITTTWKKPLVAARGEQGDNVPEQEVVPKAPLSSIKMRVSI